MTSSPLFSLFLRYGFIKHCKASKFADEPEFTISEFFTLSFFVNACSKLNVLEPIVNLLDFNTLIPSLMSLGLYGFSTNG